ncbi:MAG: hypothetical protein U9N61_11990, partial [Euryarchaeota archaeon]|nr:hypothetical protein [Euryarchaeota archaeon]
MPTRLSNKIQRITKPTKFHATVIDVAGSRISVQCGSGGPKLKNLVFTGSVELGDQVIVQWDGDAPVVIAPTHAQYDSLSSEQEESSVVGSLEDIDDDATTYDPDHTHEEDDITDLEHSAIKLQGKDIPEAVTGDDG